MESSRGRWRRLWPVTLGAALAGAVVAAAAAPIGASLHGFPVLFAVPLALAEGVSVALALRMPRISAVLATAVVLASLVGTAGADPAGAPWPVPVAVIVGTALVVTAVGVSGRIALSAATAGALTVAIAAAVAVRLIETGALPPLGNPLAGMISSGAAAVVGSSLGALALARSLAASDRQAAERARESARIADERRVAARELHDVIAHSLSLVHMRASSARFRLDGLDPAVADEFDAISGDARSAMREMQRVVSILRADGEATPTGPQPGLAEIRELLESARASGARVEESIEVGGGVPADLQLALHRIVQEGITNALRHAPGATVAVAVTESSAGLAVHVSNALPTRPGSALPSGRWGLTSLRERVDLAGGELEVGPGPDGRWILEATIPWSDRG